MAVKKYVNKAGRLKDYLKGIISLVVGIVLIIVGAACIHILPLAIVFFILGGSATLTGLGLIIHNKKNNTHYSDPDAKPSSSSIELPKDRHDWGYKFKVEIEDIMCASARPSVYTFVENGVIEVQVTIYASAWTGAGAEADEIEAAKRYRQTVSSVQSKYKKVAKNCPFPSRLSVKRG